MPRTASADARLNRGAPLLPLGFGSIFFFFEADQALSLRTLRGLQSLWKGTLGLQGLKAACSVLDSLIDAVGLKAAPVQHPSWWSSAPAAFLGELIRATSPSKASERRSLFKRYEALSGLQVATWRHSSTASSLTSPGRLQPTKFQEAFDSKLDRTGFQARQLLSQGRVTEAGTATTSLFFSGFKRDAAKPDAQLDEATTQRASFKAAL